MSTNSDTVMAIYEAFGRGDAAFILDRLAEDVHWDHGLRETGVPYLRPGTGRQHAAAFFGAVAENVEFTTFEPSAPCAADDRVVVVVREAGRNRITGRSLPEDLFVHVWTFGPDGTVASFRHIGDLAIHERAAAVAEPVDA